MIYCVIALTLLGAYQGFRRYNAEATIETIVAAIADNRIHVEETDEGYLINIDYEV